MKYIIPGQVAHELSCMRLPVSMEAATYECTSLNYIAQFYVVESCNAPAYDLSDTFFTYECDRDQVLTNHKLADYENSTLEVIKKINEVDFQDRYYYEQGKLYYTQKIYDIIEEANNPLLKVEDFELPYEKEFNGMEYTSLENIYFNLYNINEDELTAEQKEDYNVGKAILALHYFQNAEEIYHKTYINYQGDEQNRVENYAYTDNFQMLIDLLEEGIPTAICACEHAINAISLKQDNEDSSLYYLDVYDSNYLGDTHRLEIKSYVNKEKRTKLVTIDISINESSEYIYEIKDISNSFTKDDSDISLYVEDLRCFEK